MPASSFPFNDPFYQLHKQISKNDILHAVDSLRKAVNPDKPDGFPDLLDSIANDYSLMLDFMASGGADPQRAKILASLRFRLHDIADSIELDSHLDKGDVRTRPHEEARCDYIRNNVPSLVADYKQKSLTIPCGLDAMDILCRALDIQRLSESEVSLVFDYIIRDADTPDAERAYAVGVLAHNIVFRHNIHLARHFVKAFADDALTGQTAARAAVTIVASILSHPYRWQEDDELLASLKQAAASNPRFNLWAKASFSMFAKTNITGEIERFFTEDMAQEISRLAENIMEHKDKVTSKINPEEIEAIFGADNNPSIIDKFSQLAKWQEDGADVNFATHSAMKTSDFFRPAANWFRPYDPDSSPVQYALQKIEPEFRQRLANAIAQMPMPDSDKYSTANVLGRMSLPSVGDICQTFEEEGRRSADARAANASIPPGTAAELLAADNFVKDLYRAFIIEPDLMGQSILFSQDNWQVQFDAVSVFFPSPSDADSLGRSLVKYNCWGAAARIYEKLLGDPPSSDVTTMRKLALCLKRKGDDVDALDILIHADSIDGSDAWTKQTIAQWQFENCEYARCLSSLVGAEQIKPLSPRLATIKGRCQLLLHKTSEALNTFLGLTFTAPDQGAGYQGAAQCQFLLGRPDEAVKYVGMLRENNVVESTDLLACEAILGLVSLAASNIPDAIAHFRHIDGVEVESLICNSNVALLTYGLKQSDIDLFTEIVRRGC